MPDKPHKMKSFLIKIALFFLILSCKGQEKPIEERQALISAILDEFPEQTQFAVGIIENGEVSFTGSLKEQDGIVAVNNKKSIFEIGSISKVFTATLLANAIIEEKVKPNDLVNDYLDFEINNNYEFKLVELANHTSSLPRMPGNFMFYIQDMNNPYKDYDEKALKEFLEVHIKLPDDKERGYEYSNLGAGLLGYALTKIYTKSFEELLAEKVFEKYNMNSSCTNVNLINQPLVQGLTDKGETTSNWDLNILAGAGGILSNVEDLSKFMLAQFEPNNKALNLTRKETFKIDDNGAVALGWHIKKDAASKEYHWHNGGTGGYRSSMIIDIENKNGIVILSNVSGLHKNASKIDDLASELLKILD